MTESLADQSARRLLKGTAARIVEASVGSSHACGTERRLRSRCCGVYIDIALPWDRKSLEGAERALTSMGLVSRLPVTAGDVFHFRDEYVHSRNLIAWNFYNPQNAAELVDIVVTYDLRGKRRQRVDTADGPVHILSRKDLVAMKRAGGRPQDLEDADALERLR